jgi:hypothetical protein
MTEDRWKPHTKSRNMNPSLRETPREWKSEGAIQGRKNGTLHFFVEEWERIKEVLRKV